MNNLEKYQNDLAELIEKGEKLKNSLSDEINLIENLVAKGKGTAKNSNNFKSFYDEWYSEALAIIRQLMPYRLEDFISLYKNEKRKKLDEDTYTISDYLHGIKVETIFDFNKKNDSANQTLKNKFEQQLNIVKSLKQRFESSLFDIKQLVQADLFDSEIATAKELNKKGFHRASGVICGVIIEKHLAEVCVTHTITITKKNPTISDLNDLLKNNNVIDVIVWRFLQRLGDIRNLCGHNKDREPTKEEVEELVNGTDKIIKTVF